ncbi:FG-GAP-like repeat-containing protein [Streptomyces lavendulocolor]|uniref:FG-GAP-like repeat-containing protein n=3 Tax=Streptomyces lavendulocolor TaxID=67316 RepID=A0ABV2VZG4_9ACTN
MPRHALTRSGASVVLSVALAGTLVPLFPGAALAADGPAAEVVVPAPVRYQPRADTVLEAGADGFLHQREGTTGTLWTEYATGATTPLTATGDGYGGMRAALDPATPGAPRTVSITALGSTETRKVEVPEGASWTKGFTADSILVSRPAADGSLASLGVVRMRDGKAVEQPVTGVPGGFRLMHGVAYQRTAKGAVVFLATPDGAVEKEYLVDYATAELRELPDHGDVDLEQFGDRHLLDRYGGDTVLHLRTVPRDDPMATPVVTKLPSPPQGYRVDPLWPTLIGDWIVFGWSPESWATKLPGVRLQAIPVGGGEVRSLLAHSTAAPQAAPDGSLLVTGGAGATDWAVRRIGRDAAGVPVVTKVDDVPPATTTVDGLTLGAGVLHYRATSDASPYPALYERLLSVTGTPTAGNRILRRSVPAAVDALVPLGNGESAHQTGSDVLAASGEHADGMYGRLSGGSGRYVVSGTATTQYVGDLQRQFGTRSFSGRGASAVWGTTVWLSDPAKPSTVSWYDVKTKATSAALAIGSGCTPDRLQAVGRWIHWSCAKGAKAGVWDQKTRLSTPVPFGETQLGDGFVVRKDGAAGKLTLTDVHTGDPAAVRTTDFASVPAGADWSVDKFGGHVAFTDAEERIHIKPVTVPRSPIAVIEDRVDATVLNVADGRDGAWHGTWQLSRPAVRTSMEIRNRAGATVAAWSSGDRSGARFSMAWDGRGGADRAFVPAGHYTWTLSADPGDGSGPRTLRTGTVQVADVHLPFRDYDRDGIGELFSRSGGGLTAHEPVKAASTTSTGWTGVNHVVPFGDLDNDGCNDVLTRTTTGDLYRHSAKCGGVVTPTSPKAKIGAGFNAFDALLSPGDMSGDGRPDLLARVRSTGDLYLYADNAAGGIGGGVRIAGKWNGLTLIGAGDLDGDGHADLLTRDAGGELWRHRSTGTGAFHPRVLVFSDWGAGRDAIIGAGDVDGDGKNDLVSRDANGKLLRNSGRGNGTFGPTIQIGSGWGARGALY